MLKTLAEVLNAGAFEWEGKGAIPDVGEDVTVRLNQLGPGVVVGFELISGHKANPSLALCVRLTAPPKWHQDFWEAECRRGRKLPDYVVVYGAEVLPRPARLSA